MLFVFVLRGGEQKKTWGNILFNKNYAGKKNCKLLKTKTKTNKNKYKNKKKRKTH